jgi:hypothetical protein
MHSEAYPNINSIDIELEQGTNKKRIDSPDGIIGELPESKAEGYGC